MGFKNGAYGKVWSIEDKGKYTKINLSTSRKIKGTEPPEYDTDFSSYVSLVGEAHKKAKETVGLTVGERIRILDCETTTKYDKAKDVKYTNHTIYDWEPAGTSNGNSSGSGEVVTTNPPITIPDEEPDDDEDTDDLPF